MLKKMLILMGVVGVLLATGSLSAQTIIPGGPVSGTWNESGSPYLIEGDTWINSGSTLNINPGVEVIFQGHYKFNVYGYLHAIGTETDSVIFTSAVPDSGWRGIRFCEAPDTSQLSYCIVEYGAAIMGGPYENGGGVWCHFSSPMINHCTIRYNYADSLGGGICCEDGSPMIDQCTICNNSASYFWSGNWGGGGGIYCSNSCASIIDCVISGNSATEGGGIYARNSNLTISTNTINGNGAEYAGGGIFCDESSPMIENNVISDNWGDLHLGSGICCRNNSNPVIDNNTIYGNAAYGQISWGAGIYCSESNPTITNNLIIENTGGYDDSYGGGICCTDYSCPNIDANIIQYNWAEHGGGICCSDSSNPTITNNMISVNEAMYGGGIKSIYSDAMISSNVISLNDAWDTGGGIRIWGGSPSITQNDISGNLAWHGGGITSHTWEDENPIICNNYIFGNSGSPGSGIWCYGNLTLTGNTICGNVGYEACINCYDADVIIQNCIIWGNEDPQILGSSVTATYSDIQGAWPGTGNIDLYPQFVDTTWNDFRLKWGSPCIDAGNPDPIYNDPDGTVADMGCYYYDQSVPVRILLTPHEAPIQIPAGGGNFNYTIRATNIAPISHLVTAWCEVTLPDGTVYGPVLGPLSVTLSSGETRSVERTQTVPGSAPEGMYSYHVYGVAAGNLSTDSFTFSKLGAGGLDWASGWFNTGESFDEATSMLYNVGAPRIYSLNQNYPNPFNPTTNIRFTLPEAQKVSLIIYNATGRQVAKLIDGLRNEGMHEVTFDASGLASGLYIYRLQTDDYTASGKMVLLK